MRAYKFLSAGAIAPFTGRAWPTPGPHGPGAWIVAAGPDLARYGVHACNADDLAWWPDDELWVVELDGTILREGVQLAAERGRLVEHVTAWSPSTAREYAAACAWRARDLVAAALSRAALDAESASLRACMGLETLEHTARTLSGDARREDPRALAAYVGGAALRAREGRFREASLQDAHLAAALARSDLGAERERAWQSRWLADRLGLRDLLGRTDVTAAAQ